MEINANLSFNVMFYFWFIDKYIGFYATDESFTANNVKKKEKEREKRINISLVCQILSIIECFFRGLGLNS